MSISRQRPQDCVRLDTTIKLSKFYHKMRNDMYLDTASDQEMARDTFSAYAEIAFNALAEDGSEKVTLTLYRIPANKARFQSLDGTCDGPEDGFSALGED